MCSMCSGESNFSKNFGSTLPNSSEHVSLQKHHLKDSQLGKTSPSYVFGRDVLAFLARKKVT